MLYAYTKEKELISAVSDQQNQFFCPDCGEQVIRKAGKIKIPHFAHGQKSQCYGLSEGETFEHLKLKKLFYRWGVRFEPKWQMEKPLADLSQRPDLLNERLAVEIQCSALPTTRLAERIAGYREKNYQDWWVLGKNLWPKEKFTQLQRQFCGFDQDRGIHLWLLEEKQLRLIFHIHEKKQSIAYFEKCWPVFSQPLMEIFRGQVKQSPPRMLLTTKTIRETKQILSLKLLRKNPRLVAIQRFLYQQHRHLSYLPEWMYAPSRYFFFFQEDILVFRYLFQKEAKHASNIFQQFLAFRKNAQREWFFHHIDQQEILERLYLEAIFCQRKAKLLFL